MLLRELTTAAQEDPTLVTLDLSFIPTIYHNTLMQLHKTYPGVPQGNVHDIYALFYPFGRV